MKKVLILANSSKGVYGFRNEFVLELLKQYEVTVSVPDDVCTAELQEEGCNIVTTPINRRGMNPVEDLKLLLSYGKLLRSSKPDVVLTYTIKPNVYGGFACRMNRIPYMATITGLGSAMEGEGILQKMTTFLYRISLKKASCIFFQNEENEKIFDRRKIKAKSKRRVSGSGVDLNRFSFMEMPDTAHTRFIFVSRILKEKGIEQYLEASQQIKEKYPDTEFAVLGKCEEEYEEKLQALHKKQIIQYFGMQKDVPQYLKSAHCLVHPSYYPEGMSNVCLEAAACGRAVITTKRTGCKETVEHEETGYLIEEKDTEQTRKAMERFLLLDTEAKKAMGKAGRKKVEMDFDRKLVTAAYMDEVHKALNDN